MWNWGLLYSHSRGLGSVGRDIWVFVWVGDGSGRGEECGRIWLVPMTDGLIHFHFLTPTTINPNGQAPEILRSRDASRFVFYHLSDDGKNQNGN